MDKKRYTAAELAAMHLPDLPQTKANIIARATNESWPYEEKKGIGGTRRLYEVPEKYFSGRPAETTRANQPEPTPSSNVIGTIAAGSSAVDLKKLTLAIRTLDQWEIDRGLKIHADRRPAVISVLYDYLVRNDGKDLAVVLQALG